MPTPPTITTSTITTTPDGSTTLHLTTRNTAHPTTPSLILLHYWGGSPTTWSPLLDTAAGPLPPSTTHSVAYHARGWAPSTGPADPSAYGTAHMSGDLACVVRAAGFDDDENDENNNNAGFVLVGHSMGAKVAMHYAATARPRPRGLRGMVLVAPAPLRGGLRLPREEKERQRGAYASAEAVRAVLDDVLTAGGLQEEVRERCVRDSMRGGEAATRAWVEYAAEEDFGGLEGGIEEGLPVLVVRGDGDFERGIVGELGVERGWRNEVVEGCGHLVPLEKPEVLGRMIAEFVEGLPGRK
ncbi:hydrolase [Diplodia corticola]|uniref:Hydrolase n=1 Tax=Diplodia corticola TaxID=236234 RepID=A0A1J9R5Y2_9PEZI|nr:hydrolase [Diplodia corticola]OJD35961.1 hydrolase [Diplodia corticola]